MKEEQYKLAEYVQELIKKKVFGAEISAIELVNRVLKDWEELNKYIKKSKINH